MNTDGLDVDEVMKVAADVRRRAAEEAFPAFMAKLDELADDGNTIAVEGAARIRAAADPVVAAGEVISEIFAHVAAMLARTSLAQVWDQWTSEIEDPAVRPDDCWRCDAVPATTDVGLCARCHVDLQETRT